MGMLFNLETGERVLLRAHHVFGRCETRADTCIVDADVSLMHAVARFRDGAWSLADFSRNGTLIDGEALRPGRWLALRQGQELRFGRGARSAWRVYDVSPPGTSLVPLDPQLPPILLGASQLLPNPESPEIAIFQDASGGWLIDRDGEICTLASGDAVTVCGVPHRLMLSERLDETVEAAEPLASQLVFLVSADEEHVRVRLTQGPRTIELGERSHHYFLLTLARRRLCDARSGLAPSEQGWLDCDELAGMLRVSATHLNIQVYRARQQLMSSAPSVARLASIVERRRGSLRLGDIPFEITRELRSEGRYRPSSSESRQEAHT